MEHSQNRILCTRKYQRRPSQLPFKALSYTEVERNVYDCQRQKEIGYWYLGPETSLPNLSWLVVANDEFLGSWTVHIGQDHDSLGSATMRRHMAHLRLCTLTQGANCVVEIRELHKRHGPPGTVPCPPTSHLRFWIVESKKHRANRGQCPCQATNCLPGRGVHETQGLLGIAPSCINQEAAMGGPRKNMSYLSVESPR